MTSTAVNDGRPPIFSAMPMAIGVVTDLGAIDRMVAGDAPSSHAIPIAVTIAAALPSTAPASNASQSRFSFSTC